MRKRVTTILMFVGCLPLLLVSWYYYNIIYDSTMREYNQLNTAMLSTVRMDMDSYVNNHVAALKLLAKNQQIINLDPAARSFLVESKALHPNLDIAVDDPQGNMRFRDNNEGLVNIAHRQYFQDALSGKDARSEVLISKTSGAPTVNLGIPLKNGNQITGVIQGGMLLSTLNGFLTERIEKPYGGFIIDETGKIIAHTDAKAAAERQDLSQEEYVKKGLSGQDGYVLVKDGQGQKMFLYYMYDKTLGWLICTQIPEDYVMVPVHSLQKKVALVIILLAIIIWLAGIFTAKRLVRPLEVLAQYANQVAAGNLAVEPIQVRSKDEFGELGKSFNAMIAHLRGLVKNIEGSAEQLAASSEELTASAEQSAIVTGQVANSITEVAAGTESQVRAVDEASAVIANMANKIGHVANNANAVADASEKTATAAQNGEESIKMAVTQMKNIEKTVSTSASVVETLGLRSKEIGQIVDTIAGIAGQTNLLALNAAIEAARAGEQGRGFAVVAEEVRKLAEQSEVAAKQIASLITEVQSETDKAVSSMENGTREVKIGAEVVNSAGQVFQEIVMHVSKVSGEIQEISGAIQEMATSSQKVVTSVQTVDTVSKNIGREAQAVSAATEEQAASMAEIANSSRSLASMAEKLQSAINSFSV